MRGWLGGMMAFLLSLSAPAGAAAVPVDCGPAPDAKCLAGEIFTLAKTLPEDDGFRRHVAIAEQELAPGDIKIALEYVVWDNPDPSPWEDIEWIARAGRFDRAIEQANQRNRPVERLGGLLAVAAQMLDKSDTMRATKIVEEVERLLPSIPADDNDQDASSLPHDAGEIRARLGQTERAARLISGSGIGSVDRLLAIARKYPVAANLREQAWREAERANEPYAWRLLMEDAISRGDQAEASRIAQRASNAINGDQADSAISLARVVLSAGLPDLSAKLIKPWPQWVNGKEASVQFNTVNALIPVLAGLAQDQEVQAAVRAVNDSSDRSRCSSKAAAEYFRLGRREIAEKFDAEALALAASSPTGETARRGDHGTALHNLALDRADRGDIQGALVAVSKLRDEAKVRDVTSWIVHRAINSGHGPVAGPAIEALQQIAISAQDVGLLLRAADGWYAIGSEDNARNVLSRAMNMVDMGQVQLTGSDSGTAAELTWRLDGAGKAEPIVGIVDKMGVTDPIAIDRLVEIIRPMSPAVAVQLAGRQSEVNRRIEELANIAIQVATTAK